MLGLHYCLGFSLAVMSRGYSLVVVHGLFIAVSSLVERSLWSTGSRCTGASAVAAPGLQSTGSGVVSHELSCFEICGIILDQGSNPYLLHWQVDSLPLNHQGSPQIHYYPFHLEVPGFSMGSVFHYNSQNVWAF